ENPGAFLSLGGRLPPAFRFGLLTVGVGLVLLIALIYLLKSQQLGRLHIVAMALLVGGGASNWYDRLVNDGRVVDFMVLAIGRLRTGVFNVADIAIMVGIGLMLLASRRGDSLGDHRGEPGPGAPA
ncbi:MAG TPA: signal peptidase II, partial [Myxococcaceae bacterium]